MNNFLVLGETDEKRPLILTEAERACGVHLLGAPGSGKSKAMQHMIQQDIINGTGVVAILMALCMTRSWPSVRTIASGGRSTPSMSRAATTCWGSTRSPNVRAIRARASRVA